MHHSLELSFKTRVLISSATFLITDFERRSLCQIEILWNRNCPYINSILDFEMMGIIIMFRGEICVSNFYSLSGIKNTSELITVTNKQVDNGWWTAESDDFFIKNIKSEGTSAGHMIF